MADEPSNAELSWRLEAIQRSIAELVSRAEYAARLEAAEHRFADLGADVVRLDRRHDEDIDKVHRRLNDHEKSHTDSSLSWRQIVYTAVPAAAVALLAILAQLWVGGGH